MGNLDLDFSPDRTTSGRYCQLRRQNCHPARSEPSSLGHSQSQAAARKHEVLLDSEDGLDWETLCRCDALYLAPLAELSQQRGAVILLRQAAIVRVILNSFAWRY